MAEEFKYKLSFESVSVGSGAKQANDDVERLQQSVGKLSRSIAEMQSAGSKASVSQWGFYDLDAQIKGTSQSTETFTSGVTRMEKPVRNNAQALLMFSQGFEDAQFGIRGILNNIPGLIIALGGGAGLAGAISIAAVAGSQLFTMLTKTEEATSEAADRMKTLTAAIGEAEGARFDELLQNVAQAAESADALRQSWTETSAAEDAYAQSALSNAQLIREAQLQIAEALGFQVDRYRELEESAAREAAARKQEAEQAIAAERRKMELLNAEVTAAADKLSALESVKMTGEAELVNLRAKLQLMRDQVQAAKDLTRDSSNPGLGASIATLGPLAASQNAQSTSAAKEVADKTFLQEMQVTEARVEALAGGVENAGSSIRNAQVALDKLLTKQADSSAATATKIAEIEETASAQDLRAKAAKVGEVQKLTAEELQKSFGKIETANQQGIAAKAAIEAAAKDGKITADEIAEVARSTQTLMGLIQSGQAKSLSTLQELLAIQKNFYSSQELLSQSVAALKAQVQQLSNR